MSDIGVRVQQLKLVAAGRAERQPCRRRVCMVSLCRYKHLHGKFVIHPVDGRRLPIVCDAESVDMALGTGAVKVRLDCYLQVSQSCAAVLRCFNAATDGCSRCC
jgi:tRNA synthetases class I (I, L, M and V)